MVLNLIKLNNGGREMEVVTRGKRDRYVFRFPCLFGHCHYKDVCYFLDPIRLLHKFIKWRIKECFLHLCESSLFYESSIYSSNMKQNGRVKGIKRREGGVGKENKLMKTHDPIQLSFQEWARLLVFVSV